MYKFRNDYSEGMHPAILEKIVDTNMNQTVGYTEDEYCLRASEQIKAHIEQPNADVHFFVGGTQTNLTALSAFLRPHEAIISAVSGHIFVHETGAIEATGHQIITIPHKSGKISADDVSEVLCRYAGPHMVKPRLVYISNSTEYGAVYSLEELKSLREICLANDLLLYLDGARLAVALTASGNDMTIADVAKYTDAFYIGGTKNGAMFGEALVIVNETLQADFKYLIKQRGALLAKGRLLGIQFETLFENNLFYELGARANSLASRLSEGIESAGVRLFVPTETNQIFLIVSHTQLGELEKHYDFEMWEKYDEYHEVIRFVTSWATDEKYIDEVVQLLKTL
ncbi:MAG: threonine aldolase [Epulopiscium sp. Nele67-Bin004]|nr:MAG: threonine aldolase [Epulopiscium sp. Nele67-Bin004]